MVETTPASSTRFGAEEAAATAALVDVAAVALALVEARQQAATELAAV
jgi:hypothetical protein